jgi:hypothetical protein
MMGRTLGLPLPGSISDLLRGNGRQGDLPATPEPGKQMQIGYALLGALAVPIVLATAEAHLGPGIRYQDVLALCAAYGFSMIALLAVPWSRLEPHWALAAVALPIVFVASLSALTGGGSSPYSAIYAPVLAVAGWYLRPRYLAAAIGLVITTELWRAVALDGSRSIEQLAIMLPFALAVAIGAWMSRTWLRRSLVSTRLDQVQMAATLQAAQGLGLDPAEDVLRELEASMQGVFDARATCVRLDISRSNDDHIVPAVAEGNTATILVPGTTRLHGLVTLEGDRPFTNHELRLAQILAEVAGRTLDGRDAGPITGEDVDRDFMRGLFRISKDEIADA